VIGSILTITLFAAIPAVLSALLLALYMRIVPTSGRTNYWSKIGSAPALASALLFLVIQLGVDWYDSGYFLHATFACAAVANLAVEGVSLLARRMRHG